MNTVNWSTPFDKSFCYPDKLDRLVDFHLTSKRVLLYDFTQGFIHVGVEPIDWTYDETSKFFLIKFNKLHKVPFIDDDMERATELDDDELDQIFSTLHYYCIGFKIKETQYNEKQLKALLACLFGTSVSTRIRSEKYYPFPFEGFRHYNNYYKIALAILGRIIK